MYGKDFYEEAYALKVDNVLTSHLFLVDALGKVRWSATGIPSCDDEVDDAVRFLEILKNERLRMEKEGNPIDLDSISAAQAAINNTS